VAAFWVCRGVGGWSYRDQSTCGPRGPGVMVMVSFYGETRVEPGRLCDLGDPPGTGTGPPPDAIDVQFRAPVSLSLLLDAFDAAYNDAAAQALTDGYQQLIGQMLGKVQFECGYVRDPAGSRRPARLDLAAFVENDVPGIEKMRLHAHIYVGRTAENLHDGGRHPVDLEKLHGAVDRVVFGIYAGRLRAVTEEVAEVTWGRPRPGASEEIVVPALHELAAGADRGVCPGPWGPRELLLADQHHLELSAESERVIAANQASGHRPDPYWTPPPASTGWSLPGS